MKCRSGDEQTCNEQHQPSLTLLLNFFEALQTILQNHRKISQQSEIDEMPQHCYRELGISPQNNALRGNTHYYNTMMIR